MEEKPSHAQTYCRRESRKLLAFFLPGYNGRCVWRAELPQAALLLSPGWASPRSGQHCARAQLFSLGSSGLKYLTSYPRTICQRNSHPGLMGQSRWQVKFYVSDMSRGLDYSSVHFSFSYKVPFF